MPTRLSTPLAPPPLPPEDWALSGTLVSIPVPATATRHWHLDGFYRPAPRARFRSRTPALSSPPLLVFIHGMGSNFYRSRLKKAFLQIAPRAGFPILSVNNSGADADTFDEHFLDCLHDLDAIRDWAHRRGHDRIVWIGHSTGCQKATVWEARRHSPATTAVVLLAPADDNAILLRDLGPARMAKKIAWARHQIALGNPTAPFEHGYERFSARRFLSVADPARPEAAAFRYAGRLTAFRRLRCPVLAAFGANEEFAALAPEAMLHQLGRATRSRHFTSLLIPDTGHSFREAEAAVATQVCDWLCAVLASAP